MAKKTSGAKSSGGASVSASRERSGRATARGDARPTSKPAKPSSLLDTRVVFCGDNLEQLSKLRAGNDTNFKHSHKVIGPLTMQEILDEQVAMKLV